MLNLDLSEFDRNDIIIMRLFVSYIKQERKD